MNLIQRPTLIEVLLSDDSQNRGKVTHWAAMTLTAPTIELYLPALAQQVEPLTDAEITGAEITYQYFATNATPAVPGKRLGDGAVFILSDGSGNRFALRIPAFKQDKFETTGEWAGIRVNQADPDVAALVNSLIIGDGTVAPVSPFTLNDLVILDTAYKQTGK